MRSNEEYKEIGKRCRGAERLLFLVRKKGGYKGECIR